MRTYRNAIIMNDCEMNFLELGSVSLTRLLEEVDYNGATALCSQGLVTRAELSDAINTINTIIANYTHTIIK